MADGLPLTTRLWITRTQPSANRSAEVWRNAGFTPIIAPLIDIQPVRWHGLLPDNAELIFTSGQAVRHCGLSPDKDRIVYTVGNATARIAKQAGFERVISANGNWKSLIGIIESSGRPIIHLCGNIVRGSIVETLQAQGRVAARQFVYRSTPVTDWPVKSGEFEAVALYSPMASETLMALPKRNLSGVKAYCLSDNVAAPLRDLETFVAKEPTEEALIACSHRQSR